MTQKAVAKGEHLLSLMTDFPNKFIYYPLAHLLYYPVALTPVTPTQITIAHILCAIAGTVFLIRGEPGDILITFVLFQVRAVFDCLDGTLARRKNMSSEIGRIIDNLGDAIGFLCLMSGFTVYFTRSGRFTGLEIFALIFLTVLVSGIMAQGTDFYRRKFSYALKEDRDIISEEISRKHHTLREGGGSPLLWWGYANDWFQILVFAPASLRHLREHIRSSRKPEEYRYDVEKIRANTDSPRLKLAMFITAMMSGDNAVFVITLGLLTDKPEYGLFANLAYGIFMLIAAAITMNFFFHRKAVRA